MWTQDQIKSLLNTSDNAVVRAVSAIYALQTADEKVTGDTRHHNGVGFNGVDARLGSYYADWISKHGRLTGQHLNRARRMMLKYTRQLAAIANEQRGEGAVEPTMVAAEPEPSYRRLTSHCECENFDGERVCDWCLDPENAEARLVMLEVRDIQRAEREEAQRVAAFKMRRDDALRVADHW